MNSFHVHINTVLFFDTKHDNICAHGINFRLRVEKDCMSDFLISTKTAETWVKRKCGVIKCININQSSKDQVSTVMLYC